MLSYNLTLRSGSSQSLSKCIKSISLEQYLLSDFHESSDNSFIMLAFSGWLTCFITWHCNKVSKLSLPRRWGQESPFFCWALLLEDPLQNGDWLQHWVVVRLICFSCKYREHWSLVIKIGLYFPFNNGTEKLSNWGKRKTFSLGARCRSTLFAACEEEGSTRECSVLSLLSFLLRTTRLTWAHSFNK